VIISWEIVIQGLYSHKSLNGFLSENQFKVWNFSDIDAVAMAYQGSVGQIHYINIHDCAIWNKMMGFKL
jgi:hypothetical protein